MLTQDVPGISCDRLRLKWHATGLDSSGRKPDLVDRLMEFAVRGAVASPVKKVRLMPGWPASFDGKMSGNPCDEAHRVRSFEGLKVF